MFILSNTLPCAFVYIIYLSIYSLMMQDNDSRIFFKHLYVYELSKTAIKKNSFKKSYLDCSATLIMHKDFNLFV